MSLSRTMGESVQDDKNAAIAFNGTADDTGRLFSERAESERLKAFGQSFFHGPWVCILGGCFIGICMGIIIIFELSVHKDVIRMDWGTEGSTFVMNLTVKPQDETRTFQYAKLSNGIEVVTVRDASALQKAFANAVESGSFDEPINIPGLAHFCEHMLFLGTSKYKDPEGFDNFLAGHGGGANAYTSDEATVYFAGVDQAGAVEGLDRFADFFKTPLFSTAYVDKEVHAIDSEHAKNIQNPSRQIFEVLRSLAAPGSPVSRFHTGDIQTLITDPQKEKPPVDPVEALREYWKTHYCPDRMKIVTAGSETNAKQLELLEEEFGGLQPHSKACEAKRPKFDHIDPWPPERMQKWVNVQGMLPIASIWLQFWLPETTSMYDSSPLDYIEYVLTYSGEGSLYRVLTDSLGLAATMNVMFDASSAGTAMHITFQLTKEGRKHPELLLNVIFAYLAELRRDGVNESLYESMATVDKLRWDWGGQQDPESTVEYLAGLLTRVKPKDLLWAESIINNPNPQLVQSLMKRLSPSNMVIAFVNEASQSKEEPDDTFFKGQEIQTLAHYGVNYSVQDFGQVLSLGALGRWADWLDGKTTMASVEKAIQDSIQENGIKVTPNGVIMPKCPGKIDDIPRVLQVKHMYAASSAYPEKEPIDTLLYGSTPARVDLQGPIDSPYTKDAEVWYRSGWMTRSPKVRLSIDLRPLKTPDELDSSALDDVRLSLYGRLLSEEMSPKLVDITAAGMSYEVSIGADGISFDFVGFAPSMPDLIKKVLFEFNAFNKDSSLTPQVRWDRQRHQYRQRLKTYSSLPISYAIGDRNSLLTKGSKSRAELLDALDHKEAELKFCATSVSDLLLSRQLRLTALSMGNLAEDEAREMIGDFVHSIETPKTITMAQGPDAKVERLTPIVNIQKPVEVRKSNPRLNDKNDVAVVSILAGPSTVESRVILALIAKIFGQTAYNELRTNQQLGYIASAGASSLSNVQMLSCVVQGDRLDADAMAASIHYVYTDVMPRRLANLTDKEFNNIKTALRHDLIQPPVTYSSEFGHFDGPVDQGGIGFDILNEMLKYLDGPVTVKETLQAEWNRLVLPEDGERKTITVKYFANKASLKPQTLEQAKELWTKHKVPPDAMALLEREFHVTEHLTKVDSQEVAKLAKDGGYFSTEPNLKLKDPKTAAKEPIEVPQQIKDLIAKRKEEEESFVDTPIEYAAKGVTKSTSKRESGGNRRNMRAYSMAPRASFALVPDK